MKVKSATPFDCAAKLKLSLPYDLPLHVLTHRQCVSIGSAVFVPAQRPHLPEEDIKLFQSFHLLLSKQARDEVSPTRIS